MAVVQPLDLATWPRAATFQHYRAHPCTFNVTAEVDVTALKAAPVPFASALIYVICQAVNALPALRMTLQEGQPGYWEQILPTYTVFRPESQTFAVLWTELGDSYADFQTRFRADAQAHADSPDFYPKGRPPAHAVNISIAPWLGFTAFELTFTGEEDYLLPVFTAGQYREGDGRLWLPLSVRANHAACDGWHVAEFYREVQERVNSFRIEK
ncbi:Chloramphenicol O-acetyltransferase [Deinococcus proteolyticus MRP]|uniref:Chloramphenicol O-acetyltransferase n=1 Tax=Deinococcus proteolyticus (strain ATCC 35074 / DSM 20540 / JCM 6276 / NBRC 101906 / NCIMB 13154 / VKM Ac-1939 / CCM 2703 / MRP) TaxID=693977 RepID=F0RNY0_DEIPM|nr:MULTISPECIES: chloramphenicol acetyltransferase CAT [Deinococcus]ADY26389.1 Chloramphenicol O-acetyltransferase [Deinococcus proteolyticus MRP]MCY1702508.1 chloramphenicol acetyltransferase CAT [Deinococcus sp. SL84]